MATNRILQLLRSNTTYASFSAAKSAVEGLTSGHHDGEILLARYISGTTGEEPNVTNTYETAIGVYFEAQSKWTVFKSSTELDAQIAALQSELDATQTGAGLGNNGSYTAPTGSQDGYDVIGTATSLNDAINKIAKAIEDMDYSNNYTAATTGNDPVAAHATDASKVISGVNQENGVLDTVTTDAVDLLLTGYANDGSNSGDIAATDTLEDALNKLENATTTGVQVSARTGNQITRVTGDATAANNGLYSHVEIAQLTAQEVTALSDSNVREAYKLINPTDRTAIGDVIKIYKDSALTDVYLGKTDDVLSVQGSTYNRATDITPGQNGSEALCFVYHLEDGTYSLQAVDVESFLNESEFGDGLQVVSNEVSVLKDSSSEQVYTAASTAADVLSVSSNGVKVANVQNAINYATDQVLDTSVTASSERGVYGESSTTPHISITETTDQTTGLHSYAITETDIASEDELDAEITRATTAEAAIDSAVGLTKAQNGETRSYTSHVTAGSGESAPTTVAGDIALLDAHVQALDGAAVKSVDVASGETVISVDNTDPQNPEISFNLSQQSASTAADAAYAGGNNTSNILQVKDDGLYLDNVWDCGTY